MADHIKLNPASGNYVVQAGDTRLGVTALAVELREGGHGPVIYVPRTDIDMAMLTRTDRTTTCPSKGVASYYSVRTPAGTLHNAVWSYEAPKPGLEAISGHLAFYPSVAVTPT